MGAPDVAAETTVDACPCALVVGTRRVGWLAGLAIDENVRQVLVVSSRRMTQASSRIIRIAI
jgi:hypothetical protein